MKKIILSVSLIFLIVFCTACPLVPLIEGFKKIGATEDSRRELLEKRIKSFYNYVTAGRFLYLGEYLVEENRDILLADLRKNRNNIKIVEAEIDFITYEDKAYLANVDMLVKFFDKKYYIVKERIEKQVWKFDGVGSNWQLAERSIQLGSVQDAS